MSTSRRMTTLALALLAVALLPQPAVAQATVVTADSHRPLLPPNELAQNPPEAQQGDEDEELGEEIPDEEREQEGGDESSPGDPGGGTGSGSGGPGPDDPAPRAAQLPRTGREPLPFAAAGLLSLALGLTLRRTLAA